MTAQCGAKQGKSLPPNGTGEVGLFQYVFELYLYAVRIPQKNFHSDMFPRAAFLGSSVSATQHVAQLHFGTFRVQEVPNPDLHGISWGYRYAWYSLRSSRPPYSHPPNRGSSRAPFKRWHDSIMLLRANFFRGVPFQQVAGEKQKVRYRRGVYNPTCTLSARYRNLP